MCGIIGILGKHEVAPLLVEGLKRLEYRGYDSAGIATINNKKLDRRRSVGKLINLSDVLVHDPLAGKSGIGHTRWATHGVPNEENAHPHMARRVAVVHNGIIENFKELRNELQIAGIEQQTQTDTEIIALLFEHFLAEGMEQIDAFHATIDKLKGAYALAFLLDGQEDLMFLARKGSPLAIGHGDGEMFAGSDAIALSPLTERITYLEDGDRAILTRTTARITNANREQVGREEQRILVEDSRVDKAGYKHFMAKEIAEQPMVLNRALRAYLDEEASKISLPSDVDFAQVERLKIAACGTAFLAGSVAKYWFETLARLPVEIDIASEFRYREPPIEDKTGAIFISQSGETADTLAALAYTKSAAAWTMGISNVPTSTLAREVDHALAIHAGIEICVASTKAFTCQLMVLGVLAVKAAQDRGKMDAAQVAEHLMELKKIANIISHVLTHEPQYPQIAKDLATFDNALFFGRGTLFPIALEGALKLKELSYIHAEGYASGELKHGPIALVDKNMPIIVVAPRDGLFEKTVSNMQEVIARGAKVILISDKKGLEQSGDGIFHKIEMPHMHETWVPLVYALPMQLIAYHTALTKGTDIDQPRNLAKSVTVE